MKPRVCEAIHHPPLQELKAFKSIPNSILNCGEDLFYTLKQQNDVALVISCNVAVVVAFTVTVM